MVRYMGIFFEGEEAEDIKRLEFNPLEWNNDLLHCTFKYKPKDEELFEDLVGQEVDVYLVGYGCDGKNSGFEVAFDESFEPYYINYDNKKLDEYGAPMLKTKPSLLTLCDNIE